MTPSIWNFGSPGPHWSEIADFEHIITCSASAVTPSKKSSFNTNRKSTTCFPMSLRWSSYVDPKSPKGSSKIQNGCIPSKIALRLKKVCYKVSLCENCQWQSCKAFLGLTIHAEIIGGRRPLLPEILGQTDRVGAKSSIFLSIFARSVSDVRSSENSSIITNRKCTARFPMSLRWTSYVFPKPPHRVAEKRKVSKIWTISCDNSVTVRDRMSVTINH